MPAIDKLTKSDVQALRSFAQQVGGGIRWKGKLRDAWLTGVYRCDPETRATLQHLRNRLGTSWLTKFNFA